MQRYATQRATHATLSCNMEMTQTLLFLNGILEQSRCVVFPQQQWHCTPQANECCLSHPKLFVCLPAAALCMHETESSAITRTYYVYSCDTKHHLVRVIYEPTNVEQVTAESSTGCQCFQHIRKI